MSASPAPHEALLAELRPRAFAIAYRMLGSVAEAEDVVQEALLRLHRVLAGGERLASPRAYVATITTRLAIDQLRSARMRREQYPGEWLPEPIVEDPRSDQTDPAARAELAESLSLAFMALLERLTPEQRAVLLLRDVFGYDFGEIAAIIGKSETNVRQLAVRARRRVEEYRPRFTVAEAERRRLASAFFAALERGDFATLESHLAEEVALHGDGGGKAPALARAISGRSRVARTLAAWGRQASLVGGTARPVTVNGGAGAILADASGAVVAVMALEFEEARIVAIHSVINPDKLRHVGHVADAWSLLRKASAGTSGRD
ncbi:MAG TPA: RNA polymerase sigma factor SigJ [Candidatus Limnocylindria bacterium]|nr:RNA polymerase sigma factor SigJ [Candidatus Limnocylindria bacterium]